MCEIAWEELDGRYREEYENEEEIVGKNKSKCPPIDRRTKTKSTQLLNPDDNPT
jgi:hypothetical protein